jgi:hypothetical protein
LIAAPAKFAPARSRGIHYAKVGETLGWFPLIPQPLLPEREQGSRKSFPLAHFGQGEQKECGGLDKICVMDTQGEKGIARWAFKQGDVAGFPPGGQFTPQLIQQRPGILSPGGSREGQFLAAMPAKF